MNTRGKIYLLLNIVFISGFGTGSFIVIDEQLTIREQRAAYIRWQPRLQLHCVKW